MKYLNLYRNEYRKHYKHLSIFIFKSLCFMARQDLIDSLRSLKKFLVNNKVDFNPTFSFV